MKRHKKTRIEKIRDEVVTPTKPRVRCYFCSSRTREYVTRTINGFIHFICTGCTGSQIANQRNRR